VSVGRVFGRNRAATWTAVLAGGGHRIIRANQLALLVHRDLTGDRHQPAARSADWAAQAISSTRRNWPLPYPFAAAAMSLDPIGRL
jgi:hypothetical protein